MGAEYLGPVSKGPPPAREGKTRLRSDCGQDCWGWRKDQEVWGGGGRGVADVLICWGSDMVWVEDQGHEKPEDTKFAGTRLAKKADNPDKTEAAAAGAGE